MKITKRQLQKIIKEASKFDKWRQAALAERSPQQQLDIDDVAAIIAASPEGSREYWQTILEQALMKTGKGR